MTFEEKIVELLIAHGMWDNQAQAVMDRMKANKCNEAMSERWGDQVKDYPPLMLTVLWLSAKTEVIAYIDENCPKAWFRPMFTDAA